MCPRRTALRKGVILAMTAMLSIGVMGSACERTQETIDDLDSRITCRDYCNKKADCEQHDASRDELDACVSDCRSAIEDDCGNEHQAAANDKIAECVDQSCTEFWACMVFDAAPECFAFVGESTMAGGAKP